MPGLGPWSIHIYLHAVISPRTLSMHPNGHPQRYTALTYQNLLTQSTKKMKGGAAGGFGEGMKVGAFVLLRTHEGLELQQMMKDEFWKWKFVNTRRTEVGARAAVRCPFCALRFCLAGRG